MTLRAHVVEADELPAIGIDVLKVVSEQQRVVLVHPIPVDHLSNGSRASDTHPGVRPGQLVRGRSGRALEFF